MLRLLSCSVLILFIFLAGCNDRTDYDNDDVAAIVNGEEITVGDLRFLYADDEAIEYVKEAVKAELVKQEVEEMNIDVSGEADEEIQYIAELPSKNTENEFEQSIREFAESQADKFDMDPEAYYRKLAEITNKQSAYVVAYAQEMLGDIGEDEEKYIEEVEELLDDLVEENEDEIEIKTN